MPTYILISVLSGILFAFLDGVINANPLARRLYKAFDPIAKKSINPVAGIAIDLAYGFIMAGVFILLYANLPGASGIVKGLSFALMTWFFRVVMSVASQWMMYNLPPQTLLYTLLTGFGEMLILGVLYGFTLKPWW